MFCSIIVQVSKDKSLALPFDHLLLVTLGHSKLDFSFPSAPACSVALRIDFYYFVEISKLLDGKLKSNLEWPYITSSM